MAIDNVAEQVAQAYDGAISAYQKAREHDRMEQARETGGVSKTDKFAYERFENEAANAVYGQRDSAMNAINTALELREAELTKAPNAETINYLASISGRDDMTADEVNAAFKRHGKTHAAQKAIISAAKRSGVSIYDTQTETERDIAALRSLAATVNKEFTPIQLATTSAGRATIVKASMKGELW